MSEPTPVARSQEATQVKALVPAWQGSATLDLLEQLIDIASTVPVAVARRASLSTSELHALRHLARGPLGPADLARILGVTTAASSGIVDRLVSHGHAVRRPHELDGRRTEVVISDSGRAEAISHLLPMFTRLADLDAALDDADRDVVTRYLAGAIDAVRSLL